MRHLRHLALALMLLGATSGALSANAELPESIGVSITVDVNDCNPTTCGGGGS